MVYDVEPRSRILHWRVRQLALQRGIPTVGKLSFRLETDRQGLYPLWCDSAKSATLTRIGQLCTVLDAKPGDWFVWGETADGTRQLIWNVAEQAQKRDIPDARQFSYRARIYYQSASALWQGERSLAVLEILARIAQALNQPERGLPFDLGEMFSWEAS